MMQSESLTFQTLTTIQVQRRVILSGTPVQNDLSEYFSLLNFANPDFLGSKNDFRKNFENTIIKGRDADASDAMKADSEKKLKELGGLVTKFIIRRTNDLLSKYRTCPSCIMRDRGSDTFDLLKSPSSTNRWSSATCRHSNLLCTAISSCRQRLRNFSAAPGRSHSRLLGS